MIIIKPKIKEKLLYSFFHLINTLFVVMLVIILCLNLFVDHKIEYACKNTVEISNIILLFLGVLILMIIYFIYIKYIKSYIDKMNIKQCNITLIVYCLVLFVLQIYLAFNIYFLTGWDAGILRESAIGIANGELINSNFGYYWYYSMYPNNVFLTFIFTAIYHLSKLIKIINFEFLLVIFSIISVNISLFFITKCAAILLKNKHYCVFVVVLYTLFIGLSPWIVIPYSDTYSILFTSCVLYFYLSRNKVNTYLSWFMIFAMSLVGYLIKPTCVIVLIAIIIIELWKLLFSTKKKIKKNLKIVPVILISICVFNVINVFSIKYVGYVSNESREFPMTHFLMMGMNSETKGVYYEEDVQLTKSITGIDNKKKVNLDITKKRIENYGFSGYIGLLKNKMLTNYNDGTLGWGVEGHFYSVIFETPNSKITKLFRDIYYNDGQYYSAYATYQQTIWILILFLVFFGSIRLFKEKDFNYLVIGTTIIGITLFLLLFEARSRYLFLYSPYYLLLAAMGIKHLKIFNKCCYKNNIKKV